MSRSYKHNGLELPSVTQIISDVSNSSVPLMQWSSNCCIEWVKENCYLDIVHSWCKNSWIVPDEKLDKARFAYKEISKQALAVGSEVHSAIEEWLTKGKQKPLPESFSDNMVNEFNNAFSAFLQWEKTVKFKPIFLEKTVYGDCWAGTLDMTCYLDGKIYVIDFKTSKAIYTNDYGAQIAAYRSCIPEAEGCGILRLDKATAKYEWKDFSKRYERDLKRFEAMVVLYMLNHPRIAKKAGFNENY